MQSTGHSSMHVLSLMSTHCSVIVYVTKASSISGRCGCCLGGAEATSWCRLTDACRGVSHPDLSRLAIRAYRLILRVHTAGGFLHRRDLATKRSYSPEVSDPRSSSTASNEAPSASAPARTFPGSWDIITCLPGVC